MDLQMKKLIIFIALIIPLSSFTFNWEKYFKRMDSVKIPRFNHEQFVLSINGKRFMPENVEMNKETLRNALNSPEVSTVSKAIIVIVELKWTEFAEKFLEMLKQEERFELKKLIIWGIGSIGENQHILALVQYSHRISDYEILNTLSLAIGKISRRNGNPNPLIHLVQNSEDYMVRCSSLLSLGKIKSRNALPIVIEYARNNVKEVRFCATVALAFILNPSDESNQNEMIGWVKLEHSNYVRAALYFALLKIYGWNEDIYKRMIGLLNIPGVSSAATDFLSALPFNEGIRHLDWQANMTNSEMVRVRIQYIKMQLRLYRNQNRSQTGISSRIPSNG